MSHANDAVAFWACSCGETGNSLLDETCVRCGREEAMTERERIIEAGAIAAFNEATQHESEWEDLPSGAQRVWRGEVAAALDAMLPLILSPDGWAKCDADVLAARRKELSNG